MNMEAIAKPSLKRKRELGKETAVKTPRLPPALDDTLDMEELFESVIGTAPCLLYTSPSPRDRQKSRMPSSA